MPSNEKVALVTGVSAGGIGYGCCISTALEHQVLFASSYYDAGLLNKGWKVYGTLRSMSKAGDLASKGAHLILMDVLSTEDVKKTVEQIQTESGRLDLLVNNAGYGSVECLAELDIDKAQELYNTNVFGVLRVINAAVPLLVKTKGTICNVGSIAGFRAPPLQGIYSSSKAALHSLTDTLRCELKPLGISVVLVAPGVISNLLLSIVYRANSRLTESAFQQNELFLTKTDNPDSVYSGIDAAFKQSVKSRSGGVPNQPFCDSMVDVIVRFSTK
jgi:1-acylglycerone phosphate reductase